jgi:hypothetical protein
MGSQMDEVRNTKFRQNNLFRGDPGNSRLNACVGDNGGRYDLFDYAHGYFAATKKILEAAKHFEVGVATDTLVYPACYNFRHSIELFIKYMVATYSQMLKDDTIRFEFRHGLMENWRTVTVAASRLGWSPFEGDEVALVEKTIAEFMEIDPNGVIFRYPDSIRGEQHLQEWSLINLGIVEQRACTVFRIFEDWNYRIGSRLDR